MKKTRDPVAGIWQRPLIGLTVFLLSWAMPSLSGALEYGIASQYVGDRGIENDPNVIFSENFEGEGIETVLSGWEYATHEERMTVSSDTPVLSAGSQSLFMGGSADMYQRLLPGHDQLYIRFYAKFESVCQAPGHWVWLGGRNPSVPWPWPEAGTCPDGDERWATGVEPMGTHWAWDFYTYWMGMRSAPSSDCWGNTFSGRPSPWPVPKNEWICVEFMVKMNDPVTAHNGEQAFWINGQRMAHLGPGFPVGTWIWDGFYPGVDGRPFEGFQWRKAQGLNINYVWLEHYVPNDSGCGCWFDDLVIAKKYIGPISGAFLTVHVDPSGPCNGYMPCFSSIQEGIDAAASGATVKVVEGGYPEHLVIRETRDLDLKGGWDAGFMNQTSTTTVRSVTIDGRAGAVVVSNLTIE
ncbi:MAG: hypothetical protein K9N21_14030 [Deltaproteobacteria bacterium]|nr:hypothetical protein [Deltaproteobacteria bacterium]